MSVVISLVNLLLYNKQPYSYEHLGTNMMLIMFSRTDMNRFLQGLFLFDLDYTIAIAILQFSPDWQALELKPNKDKIN